jgi:predicted NAD/FAD-binding protein
MNKLQSIDSPTNLLVTLNRSGEINPETVLGEFHYEHPVFDAAAIAAQERRPEIQGVQATFFAGAYWGFGFHEDGVNSALDVCSHFGVGL